MWTDYPLEPARRLSEKAREVLQNVGVNEPDFDQYLQLHPIYQTWRPDEDHSDWKPEYHILGPPSGLVSSFISVHNQKILAAGKLTESQSPHLTSKKCNCTGIFPTQPVMNPFMMQPLPYSSSLDRNLKRSASEAALHDLDTSVDKYVQDRPEKKMRVTKPYQANRTPQTVTSNEVTGQVTAGEPMMNFVQHIPMDQDFAAANFRLLRG